MTLRSTPLLLGLTLFASSAEAGPVHLRAREHYETVDVTSPDGRATFSGFTNTIDLFYEVPFRYSLGVAGSPLFATLSGKGHLPGLGDTIRLVHLGCEGKAFPFEGWPVFGRLGVYRTTLASRDAAGTLQGESVLFGLGFEVDLGGIGLAPEMSWRRGELSQAVGFVGLAPAIGVHFYRDL